MSDDAVSKNKAKPDTVIFHSGSSTVKAPYHPGETLLDTARRVGVPIATSCELGDCGTCMVELLKGTVHMDNNNALSPEDVNAGCVLACQGIPEGKRCEIRID